LINSGEALRLLQINGGLFFLPPVGGKTKKPPFAVSFNFLKSRVVTSKSGAVDSDYEVFNAFIF